MKIGIAAASFPWLLIVKLSHKRNWGHNPFLAVQYRAISRLVSTTMLVSTRHATPMQHQYRHNIVPQYHRIIASSLNVCASSIMNIQMYPHAQNDMRWNEQTK